jgi:hypothetical protein
MAFLGKLNGLPAGRADLPAAPAALRTFSIDIVRGKLQPSHHP